MSNHGNIAGEGLDRINAGVSQGRQGFRSVRTGAAPVWFAGVLAVVLLIAGGVGYRAAASGLKRIRSKPVSLPVPLSAVPMHINGWTGVDVPLDPETEEYIRTNFGDDYINRRYTNVTSGLSAGVYVVYCSSYPSGLLGHKPDVCFPAHGWIRDSTTPIKIATRAGENIACLTHQFHKPAPAYAEVSVLSFYVVNGQTTLDESGFSGLWGRRPNISGDPAKYVAQVQVSSEFDRVSQSVATDLVDAILTFLPDPQGRVRAASLPASPVTGSDSDVATRQD